MNYLESRRKIDKIRQDYRSAGDVIFKVAFQYVIEYGRNTFKDDVWFEDMIYDIDERHDLAKQNNRNLFITRDFEKGILECARELSQIEAYALLIYIQQERVWN